MPRSAAPAMDEEQQPKKALWKPSWTTFFAEEVSAGWGDAVLIVGCFATGLQDAAVFNIWSCFVSMQTGNTVYVGLGASGHPVSQPWRWSKSGTSILGFMLGSYLFSRLMRHLTPLRRSTVMVSISLQAVLIFSAALLSTLHIVPRDAGDLIPDNFIVLLPLTLLSIQSGGQCVLSRLLGYIEIPTVVLTSAYCDLVMDEKVFTAALTENSQRNRRIGSVLMMVGGAVVGGMLTKGEDIGTALWTVGAIKVGMAAVWLLWRPKGGRVRLE